jgi:diguanylate cyclase (GGDEF)-like protein/PAS domain S-box-containing protein
MNNIVKRKTSKNYRTSPFSLAISVIFAIFAVEIIVMYFLKLLLIENYILVIFIDSTLLIFILLPILYFLIYRPFSRQVHDLQLAESELNNINDLLDQIICDMHDGLIACNRSYIITKVNDRFLKLYEMKRKEVIGKYCYEVMYTRDKPCMTEDKPCPHYDVFNTAEHFHAEHIHKDRNGNNIYIELYSFPLFDKDGHVDQVVALHHDITEQKLLQEKLRNLSLRDELTGLYNRRGFMLFAQQEFKRALRENRRIIIMYIDLNELKLINDTYGHSSGDRAIKEVAALMQTCFRETDIIGRLGGDEFGVLASEAEPGSANVLHERMKEKLVAFNAASHLSFELSISIGIVNCDPSKGKILDEVLEEADALMYEQKQNRKKRDSI